VLSGRLVDSYFHFQAVGVFKRSLPRSSTPNCLWPRRLGLCRRPPCGRPRNADRPNVKPKFGPPPVAGPTSLEIMPAVSRHFNSQCKWNNLKMCACADAAQHCQPMAWAGGLGSPSIGPTVRSSVV
jgi:hypothetical protein